VTDWSGLSAVGDALAGLGTVGAAVAAGIIFHSERRERQKTAAHVLHISTTRLRLLGAGNRRRSQWLVSVTLRNYGNDMAVVESITAADPDAYVWTPQQGYREPLTLSPGDEETPMANIRVDTPGHETPEMHVVYLCRGLRWRASTDSGSKPVLIDP
jgi:hypothetical protein